jgi:hypothetical protein
LSVCRTSDVRLHEVVNLQPLVEGNPSQSLINRLRQIQAVADDGWALVATPACASQ